MRKINITMSLITLLVFGCIISSNVKNTKSTETKVTQPEITTPIETTDANTVEVEIIEIKEGESKEDVKKLLIDLKHAGYRIEYPIAKGPYKGFYASMERNHNNDGGNLLSLINSETKDIVFFYDHDNSGNIGTCKEDRYACFKSNGSQEIYTLTSATVNLQKRPRRVPRNVMMEENVNYQEILEQINEK